MSIIPKRNLGEITHKSNLLFIIIFAVIVFTCIFPFIFTVVISFTSENSIAIHGYRIIPHEWSLSAYEYIFKVGTQILRSYWITIVITIMGTAISLFLTALFAYAVAQEDYTFAKPLAFIAFFTMLFSGGLVPTYIIVTKLLFLKNTIWALILPMALSAMNVLIVRTYFKTNVPRALIEAARIDGAGEFRIFYKIVLPLSKPILAVIAFFNIVAYWNSWMPALLYIDRPELTPIMKLLMDIQNNMEFLVKNSAMTGMSAFKMIQNMPSESAKMAVVVLVVVPIIIVYPFVQKYFVKGLLIGGVKD